MLFQSQAPLGPASAYPSKTDAQHLLFGIFLLRCYSPDFLSSGVADLYHVRLLSMRLYHKSLIHPEPAIKPLVAVVDAQFSRIHLNIFCIHSFRAVVFNDDIAAELPLIQSSCKTQPGSACAAHVHADL